MPSHGALFRLLHCYAIRGVASRVEADGATQPTPRSASGAGRSSVDRSAGPARPRAAATTDAAHKSVSMTLHPTATSPASSVEHRRSPRGAGATESALPAGFNRSRMGTVSARGERGSPLHTHTPRADEGTTDMSDRTDQPGNDEPGPTVTRVVNAPVDAVWAVLADGWSYPVWVVGASRVCARSTPAGPRSALASTMRSGPGPWSCRMTAG